MDDLFEKLKSAPSINKYVREAPPPPSREKTATTIRGARLSDANEETKLNGKANKNTSFTSPSIPAKKAKISVTPNQKEMIPPTSAKKKEQTTPTPKKKEIVTPSPKKVTPTVATPPKKRVSGVLEEFSFFKKTEPKTLPKKESPAVSKKSTLAKELANLSPFLTAAPPSPKKSTPTKAQQKSFEAVVEPSTSHKKKASTVDKKFITKRCVVKIKRENLKHLQKKHLKQRLLNKNNPEKKRGRPRKYPPTDANQSPPTKSRSSSSSPDKRTNFFIKLQTPSKVKQAEKSKSKSSSKKSHNKITKSNNNNNNSIRRNLKYSELYKIHGKRFFTSFVRIERCNHPLVRKYVMNERAKRDQARKLKKPKSKNLSVSFKEQVEIFGESCSSEDDADANASISSKDASQISGASPLLVTPARLKKVENGMVVADIKLDSSMFLDPSGVSSSSTPNSPGRKKHDKKYSPLKDDVGYSPRKELLKMANEKMPPTGLRNFNLDDDEDEDDDCEYIVPTSVPDRRPSAASSISGDNNPEPKKAKPPIKAKKAKKHDPSKDGSTSSGSFASAQDNLGDLDYSTAFIDDIQAVLNSFGEIINKNNKESEPEAQSNDTPAAGEANNAETPTLEEEKENGDKPAEVITPMDLFSAAAVTPDLIGSPSFLDADSNNELVDNFVSETINKLDKDINLDEGDENAFAATAQEEE